MIAGPAPAARRRRTALFTVGALALAALLSACIDHFGPGLDGLAAMRGWQPMPIASWVVNDGIDPKALVFCPRETCAEQGMAALIVIGGAEAARWRRALDGDAGTLRRSFAGKPSTRSETRVTRLPENERRALLVELAAKQGGKQAAAAILYRPAGEGLAVAFAVAPQPQSALSHARAALDSGP